MRTMEQLDRMTTAQHNRKVNKNSGTGHKNIYKQGKWYRVSVAYHYIGIRATLEEAIVLRDTARKKMGMRDAI
jgi:hypothetical protein